MMLERHARYVPVMDGTTLLGVVSFHDVAKAVYEEQSFENRMLKSYISSCTGSVDDGYSRGPPHSQRSSSSPAVQAHAMTCLGSAGFTRCASKPAAFARAMCSSAPSR